MEFALEEIRATFGVADVFGGVAAGAELDGYGAALEGSAEILDSLAMGVIESLGNTEDGGEAADDALFAVVERGIGGVIVVGSGLAIVIANDSGDDVAIAAVEAGDVAVEGVIFAVLVVATMGDAMAVVVKNLSSFEMDAGFSRLLMQGLEVI